VRATIQIAAADLSFRIARPKCGRTVGNEKSDMTAVSREQRGIYYLHRGLLATVFVRCISAKFVGRIDLVALGLRYFSYLEFYRSLSSTSRTVVYTASQRSHFLRDSWIRCSLAYFRLKRKAQRTSRSKLALI